MSSSSRRVAPSARAHHNRPTADARTPRDQLDQRGQGLVELSLVIPVVLVLFLAVLEFAVALNASLGVNRASQNAAHVAATAGNLRGADCLILQQVETDITMPGRASNVIDVSIQRTALGGNQVYGQQRWVRGGLSTCTLINGTTMSVPYTLVEGGYPETQRCTVLNGCALMSPPRSTVDNIGVVVRYRHPWISPLQGALDLIANGAMTGSGWTFEQRNIFRLEPTL